MKQQSDRSSLLDQNQLLDLISPPYWIRTRSWTRPGV